MRSFRFTFQHFVGAIILLAIIASGYWYHTRMQGGESTILDEVENFISKESLREDTDISIAQASISGTLIYKEGSSLYYQIPGATQSGVLVKEMAGEQIGQLADGRLFFWQPAKKSTPQLYSRLLLQKGSRFEKLLLPLEKGDTGPTTNAPPLVDPLGRYVLFTSDRASGDSQQRRGLYLYHLETQALKRLTDDAWMTVESFEVNQDGELIAFGYQQHQPKEATSPTLLGVVIYTPDYHTVNLFPEIVIDPGSPMVFEPQTGLLVLQQPKGVSSFDIFDHRVTDTIEGTTLVDASFQALLLVAQNKPLSTKGNPCPEAIEGLKALSLYRPMHTKLSKVATIPLTGLAQPSFQAFSLDQPQLLLQTVAEKTCQIQLGIYDYEQDTWIDVEIPPTSEVFWAHL